MRGRGPAAASADGEAPAVPPEVQAKIDAAEARSNWASKLGTGLRKKEYGFDEKNTTEAPPSFGMWDLVKTRRRQRPEKWLADMQATDAIVPLSLVADPQSAGPTIRQTWEPQVVSTNAIADAVSDDTGIQIVPTWDHAAFQQSAPEPIAETPYPEMGKVRSARHLPRSLNRSLHAFILELTTKDSFTASATPRQQELRQVCLADQLCRLAQQKYAEIVASEANNDWGQYLHSARGRTRIGAWVQKKIAERSDRDIAMLL